MRVIQIFFGLVVAILLSNCGGAQSASVSPQASASLDSLISNKHFRVENQWALPTMSSSMMKIAGSGVMGPGNSGQRIDLSSNTNFLEVKGDTVKAYLPYFGERQMGGGYNSDGEGIQFDQLAEDFEIDYNDSRKHHIVKFNANNGSESFEVTIDIYPNKKSSLIVSSSQRDMIRYEGMVSKIPEKSKKN